MRDFKLLSLRQFIMILLTSLVHGAVMENRFVPDLISKQRKHRDRIIWMSRIWFANGLVAIAILWSPPAEAQDLGSAKAFIHALFAPDNHGAEHGAASDAMAKVRTVATPALAALSEAVDAHELDFDPMCLCQESDNLKIVGVSVRADGPERAQASVALLSDRVYARRFQLVAVDGGWRVDNVTAGEESLRAILADRIEARVP
jgi:hypothetical protein